MIIAAPKLLRYPIKLNVKENPTNLLSFRKDFCPENNSKNMKRVYFLA